MVVPLFFEYSASFRPISRFPRGIQIPQQVREGLLENPAAGLRFLANRGVSAELARLAEFRASPAKRQRRPWVVLPSQNSPRFSENRAKTGKAQNCAMHCMSPRDARGSWWNARGPRRDRLGLSGTCNCYVIVAFLIYEYTE